MTASTITFAVQLGSDGFAIARTVAEKLGYHYVDWEITSKAAQDAGVSPEMVAQAEQGRSRLQRLVQSLMASSSLINEDVTLLSGPSAAAMSSAIGQLNTNDYRYFVEDVVREVADQGEAVIVGHAGQVILQTQAQVLKVLICGGEHKRAERLAAETGQKFETALASVLKSDKERNEFFKRAYGVDLLNPRLYDISINTDNLNHDDIIETILTYAGKVPAPVAEYAAPAATPVVAAVEAPPAEAAPVAVPATRQRDALMRAGESLAASLDGGVPNAKEWAKTVVSSLQALRRVFERHVRESEATQGSLDEIIKVKPFLVRRAEQIRLDHTRLQHEIADFVTELEDQIAMEEVNVDMLKEHIVRIQTSLRLHEARGSDLLHEAYNRDEGGEGH